MLGWRPTKREEDFLAILRRAPARFPGALFHDREVDLSFETVYSHNNHLEHVTHGKNPA
jgi:hypothetical protein